MPTRTWALAAGGIVIVGAAVAGGYFLGHPNNTQTQSAQAPAQPPAQPYPQESAPPANEQQGQSNYPAGYSQSVYSPWKNESYSGGGAPHRQRRVSFQYFRDELSRHGRWMHSDRWGEVWQPGEVGADFRPYEDGHWTNTREFGWTWQSNYEWGSIPFHYGRWVDDPDRGWLWVPGYVWGPGWVVWRTGSHHTGWMPMPPDEHFLRGEENERVDWSRQPEDYGYRDWYGGNYDQQRLDSHWVYVDTGHFADPDYRRYEVRRPEEIHRLYDETRDASNYVTRDNFIVDVSIDPRMVEQESGRKVETVPATKVLAKPELVAPVNAGTQIAVATHKDIPAGTGKPNSAPLANPASINAPPPPANAPLPPAPSTQGQVTATQGPPSAPVKPEEQKPNAQSNANGTTTSAPPGTPPSTQSTSNPAPQSNTARMEHRHRGEPSNAPPNTNAAGGPPSPTANNQPPASQEQGQPFAPSGERFRHRGASSIAEQQGQQPPAPSKPSSTTAATQPPTPQEQAQQPFAPNGRVEKHHRGAPSEFGQNAQPAAPPEAGPNGPPNAPPPKAATRETQQQQQPSMNGGQSTTAPEFTARREHHGREAAPGSEANAPTTPNAQNAGASPPGGTAGQSQQAATPQQQEREAKHREKKGEVVPSSLPPGSPSPYAQSPNTQSATPGEGKPQDQSERKNKRHKGENTDNGEGEGPQQQ